MKFNSHQRIRLGRVQDCDSCCRGFEPHQPPKIKQQLSLTPKEWGFFVCAFTDYLQTRLNSFGLVRVIIISALFIACSPLLFEQVLILTTKYIRQGTNYCQRGVCYGPLDLASVGSINPSPKC